MQVDLKGKQRWGERKRIVNPLHSAFVDLVDLIDGWDGLQAGLLVNSELLSRSVPEVRRALISGRRFIHPRWSASTLHKKEQDAD